MVKSIFPEKDPKKISDEVKFATFVEVTKFNLKNECYIIV